MHKTGVLIFVVESPVNIHIHSNGAAVHKRRHEPHKVYASSLSAITRRPDQPYDSHNKT